MKKYPNVFRGQGPRHVDLDLLRLVGLEFYFVRGYKTGADVLMNGATTNPELFFPAAFLYRQYIELHLKYLLASLRYFKVVTLTDDDLHFHSLETLWNWAKKGLMTKWPDSDPDPELNGAGSVILDFHNMDPTGQETRFAVTTKGKRSLDRLPGNLSLSGIRETMQQLHEVLESCSKALDSEISSTQQDEYNDAMTHLEQDESE